MPKLLAAFIALGLSCGAWSTSHAGDRYTTPLPGPLGRFFGIGYSSGYHAHHASHPTWEQRLHDFAAPSYQPVPAYGPAGCSQCAAASHPQAAPQLFIDETQPLPAQPQSAQPQSAQPQSAQPQSAPEAATRSQPIQQPAREAAPSDGAGFFKRLPNLRGAASVSEAPTPPAPPKKGSVARSSVLKIEAR